MYRNGGEGWNDSYSEFDGEAQVALQDGTTGLPQTEVKGQHSTSIKTYFFYINC